MRALLALVVMSGCVGGTVGGGGSSRPGVMPLLSELPGEASHRDAVLDSANQTAGPEHRKGMTVKERKVETGAATVAAVIGSLFSTTKNVSLGMASSFEEVPTSPQPTRTPQDPAPETQAPTEETPAIPWIKLR